MSAPARHRQSALSLVAAALSFSLMGVCVKAIGQRIPVVEVVLAAAVAAEITRQFSSLGPGAIPGRQYLRRPIRFALATADFDQHAGNVSHHMMQKRIGREGENHAFPRARDSAPCQRPNRRFRLTLT